MVVWFQISSREVFGLLLRGVMCLLRKYLDPSGWYWENIVVMYVYIYIYTHSMSSIFDMIYTHKYIYIYVCVCVTIFHSHFIISSGFWLVLVSLQASLWRIPTSPRTWGRSCFRWWGRWRCFLSELCAYTSDIDKLYFNVYCIYIYL